MHIATIRVALAICCLLLAGTGNTAEDSGSKPPSFTFKGKPVHPDVVRLLLPDLADVLPSVTTVDLEGVARSETTSVSFQKEPGGWFHVEKPGGESSGFSQYRLVGTTPGGIHVPETARSGGGSGVFCDLLFVRISSEVAIEEGRKRKCTLIKRVGSYTLGDRDDGVVTVRRHQVLIGVSRYRPGPVTLDLR